MDSRIARSAIRVAATMAASESQGGVALPGENLDVIAMQILRELRNCTNHLSYDSLTHTSDPTGRSCNFSEIHQLLALPIRGGTIRKSCIKRPASDDLSTLTVVLAQARGTPVANGLLSRRLSSGNLARHE